MGERCFREAEALKLSGRVSALEAGHSFRQRPSSAFTVVKLSRHARNEMRLYRIDQRDVEATMKAPVSRETDERGNARLSGETGDGRPILVVVAADDPDFVITAFLRS